MFPVPRPAQPAQRVLDKRAAQLPIFCKVVGRSSQQRLPAVPRLVPPLVARALTLGGPELVGKI
jgi:hypothetical protein